MNEVDFVFFCCCSYPTDARTWGIDEQFLWGSSLLVSPVLHEVIIRVPLI